MLDRHLRYIQPKAEIIKWTNFTAFTCSFLELLVEGILNLRSTERINHPHKMIIDFNYQNIRSNRPLIPRNFHIKFKFNSKRTITPFPLTKFFLPLSPFFVAIRSKISQQNLFEKINKTEPFCFFPRIIIEKKKTKSTNATEKKDE